jgi:SAM-dependent methyltransferase
VDYGEVSGIDVSEVASGAARARGHHDVRVGRLEALPWPDDAFDLVTALDVIEHTPDDRITLRELRRVTRPSGFAVVTVPAYQWLFSAHDVVNQHFRRYARRNLVDAALEAEWRIERTSYFNFGLLPLATAVRLAQRLRRGRPKMQSDFALTPSWLNGALELPLRVEAVWLLNGHRLPAGLSLLAVLSNSSHEERATPGSTV